MPEYKECSTDVIEIGIQQPKGHHCLFRKKVLFQNLILHLFCKEESKTNFSPQLSLVPSQTVMMRICYQFISIYFGPISLCQFLFSFPLKWLILMKLYPV